MLVSLSRKRWMIAVIVLLSGAIVGSILFTLLGSSSTDHEPMLMPVEQQEQEEVKTRGTSVLLVSQTDATDDEVVSAVAESSREADDSLPEDKASSSNASPAYGNDDFMAHLDNWRPTHAQTCYNAVRGLYDHAVASGVSEDNPSMVFAADNLFVGNSAQQSLRDGNEQRALNLISWAVKDLTNAGISVDTIDQSCLMPLG